jgi:hypothetical protein
VPWNKVETGSGRTVDLPDPVLYRDGRELFIIKNRENAKNNEKSD